MPAQPKQELNIDDLLNDELRKQSELRKKQMEAKKQKTISSVLGDLPNQSADKEQLPEEQSNKEKTAEQSETINQQEMQAQEDEEAEKTKPWQIKKKIQIRRKIKELEKKLKEKEKKIGKYQSTNFILLILLAGYVDTFDWLIDILWATVLLIPIALIFMLLKQMACAFIWIKIHKISKEQETGETFAVTLLALVIEMIPFISELPATIVRVLKARGAAKRKFEENKDEMEKIIKEIDKLIKQLG